MANVNISLDDMTNLVKSIDHIKEEVNKFGKRGVEDIRDSGVSGGPKGKQVNEIADQVELQFKDITAFVESLEEAAQAIVSNYTDWAYTDILKDARQDTINSEKAVGRTMKL